MKLLIKEELKKLKLKLIKYILITFCILGTFSCSQEIVYPKPKSYLRIDFPLKKYYNIVDTCYFNFKIPNYAAWEKKFKNHPNCSKTIIFPDFKAEVLCDYIQLDNNVLEISEEFRKMVYEHSFKSSAIIERTFENDLKEVYALTYLVKGNTACNYAFTITDSSKHFFSGQLVFQTQPNYDSLKPSIDFIVKDLEQLVTSFSWIN